MAGFNIETGIFSAGNINNIINMVLFKYGATINILYETYDCILHYVHCSANSHNFHINTFIIIIGILHIYNNNYTTIIYIFTISVF